MNIFRRSVFNEVLSALVVLLVGYTPAKADPSTALIGDTTQPNPAELSISAPSIQLSIQIVPSNGGTVTKTPDRSEYQAGEQVELMPVPNPDWRFAGWSGAISGDQVPYRLEMTDNMVVVAFFTRVTEYTLGLASEGQGTVSKAPDKTVYQPGESVILTATAFEGYGFAGWSGDLSGNENPTTVVMNSIKNITAEFKSLVTLTTDVIGIGAVVTSPTGVVSETQYLQGSTVTLTAIPIAGWTFSEWQGDVPSESAFSPQIQLTLDASKNVVAVFEALLEVDVQIVGRGVVVATPEQEYYTRGTSVQLFAQPGQSQDGRPWGFVGWSGNINASENPLTTTLTKSLTITATFGAIYHLAVYVDSGEGSVTWEPAGSQYVDGQMITVTALAGDGWVFVQWDKLDSITGKKVLFSDKNPLITSIDDDLTLWAKFEEASVTSQQRTYLPLVLRR